MLAKWPLTHKHIHLIAGHYGSGKTELAVSLALFAAKLRAYPRIALIDLDIANPYFRSRERRDLALQLLIPVSIGRAHILGPLSRNLFYHPAGPVHGLADRVGSGLCELHMAVAVISNQMPLCLHPLYNFLVSLYVLTHKKEGCPDISLFRPVQQFFRVILIWSVVDKKGSGESDENYQSRICWILFRSKKSC